MKQKDLLAQIQAKNDMPQGQIASVLDALGEVVSEALINGDSVALPKLGTFSTQERASRKGSNPRTGEPIVIPAKTAVKFKPTGSLAKEVA